MTTAGSSPLGAIDLKTNLEALPRRASNASLHSTRSSSKPHSSRDNNNNAESYFSQSQQSTTSILKNNNNNNNGSPNSYYLGSTTSSSTSSLSSGTTGGLSTPVVVASSSPSSSSSSPRRSSSVRFAGSRPDEGEQEEGEEERQRRERKEREMMGASGSQLFAGIAPEKEKQQQKQRKENRNQSQQNHHHQHQHHQHHHDQQQEGQQHYQQERRRSSLSQEREQERERQEEEEEQEEDLSEFYDFGNLFAFENYNKTSNFWSWGLGREMILKDGESNNNKKIALSLPKNNRVTKLELWEVEARENLLEKSERSKLAELRKQLSTDSAEAQKLKAKLSSLRDSRELCEVSIKALETSLLVDFADVQELLEDARRSLGRLTTEHFAEVRNYAKPPATVRHVLELVLIALGEQNSDFVTNPSWELVKTMIRREDFVLSVRDFEPSQLTPTAVSILTRRLKEDKTFTLERARQASVASGPLFSWLSAQLECAQVAKRSKAYNEMSRQIAMHRKRHRQIEDEIEKTEPVVQKLGKGLKEAETQIDVILFGNGHVEFAASSSSSSSSPSKSKNGGFSRQSLLTSSPFPSLSFVPATKILKHQQEQQNQQGSHLQHNLPHQVELVKSNVTVTLLRSCCFFLGAPDEVEPAFPRVVLDEAKTSAIRQAFDLPKAKPLISPNSGNKNNNSKKHSTAPAVPAFGGGGGGNTRRTRSQQNHQLGSPSSPSASAAASAAAGGGATQHITARVGRNTRPSPRHGPSSTTTTANFSNYNNNNNTQQHHSVASPHQSSPSSVASPFTGRTASTHQQQSGSPRNPVSPSIKLPSLSEQQQNNNNQTPPSSTASEEARTPSTTSTTGGERKTTPRNRQAALRNLNSKNHNNTPPATKEENNNNSAVLPHLASPVRSQLPPVAHASPHSSVSPPSHSSSPHTTGSPRQTRHHR